MVPPKKCNFHITESTRLPARLDLLILSPFLGLWPSPQKIPGSALLGSTLKTELWRVLGLSHRRRPVQLRNELAAVPDLQRNDISDVLQHRVESPGCRGRLHRTRATHFPMSPGLLDE